MRKRLRSGRPKRLIGPMDWSLTSPARGVRSDIQELLLFPLVRLFARIDLNGTEHLKSLTGPVVVVCNHTSHLDAPLVLAVLPRRIRRQTIIAAAADYFYKSQAVGALASLAIGTIPFYRHEGSEESLERCKEGLRRGWSVLIFPEGTRSKTGEMGEFKKGAAYMCLDTRTAALPLHISGAHQIMPKGKFLPRPGRVKVTFGRPVGPRLDDDYESFTKRLMVAVASLAG